MLVTGNVSFSNTLTVTGNITTSGTVESTSDARVKTNVRKLVDPLSVVMSLEGVKYDRVDNDEKDQIGFIAQDMLRTLPEVVTGSEDDGYKVAYQSIIPVLVEAIKELNNKLDFYINIKQ